MPDASDFGGGTSLLSAIVNPAARGKRVLLDRVSEVPSPPEADSGEWWLDQRRGAKVTIVIRNLLGDGHTSYQGAKHRRGNPSYGNL